MKESKGVKTLLLLMHEAVIKEEALEVKLEKEKRLWRRIRADGDQGIRHFAAAHLR